MKFFDFCTIVTKSAEVLEYLRHNGVLLETMQCVKCDKAMSTQIHGRSPDGFSFRCCSCKSRKSVRHHSFLADCRISLAKFASLIYLLNAELLLKNIAELLELDDDTVISYANLIREERGRDLIQHGRMLGGEGRRVQVRYIE